MRLICEPTSAAIAYGFHEVEEGEEEKNIIIFDIGGGTFDVTLLSATGGLIDV